jgi:ABC-2 type transport system permease protein
VARREITEILRTRTFRLVTVILMAAAVAAVVIPHHLGSHRTTYRFGLVGSTPAGLAGALVAQGPLIHARVQTRVLADEPAARAAVKAKTIDAALVDGGRLVVRRSDPKLALLANRAVSEARLRRRLASAGVPADEAASLIEPAPLPTAELNPFSPAHNANRSLAFAGVLLIYLGLITYGSMVSQGIAEEKSTRVSEVLLGALRPYQLLAGKIAGIGAVGVLQLLAIGLPVAAVALGQGSLHVPRGTALTFAAVLVWYLLGYALYSGAYAAAGATASRPQEAAAASAPVTFLVAASYGVAFACLANPDSTAARVFSFIPPLAPMAMLPRAAAGHVAPWEVPLSMTLVLVFTYGLVRLAGRIYSGAVVGTGTRVKLGDAWRSGSPTPDPVHQGEGPRSSVSS